MSFSEQERALFDLLFDRGLRSEFTKDCVEALSSYGLTSAELEDFQQTRPDALEMDAKMRIYLLLSHWSKSYPVTFSVFSSLDGGVDALKALVDAHIMRTPPIDRIATYGSRLREWLDSYPFESAGEQARVLAILGAEFGMVWSGASIKHAALKGEVSIIEPADIRADWPSKPIKLAAYVCAILIPQSYVQLKQDLCPRIDDEFWRNLSNQPLSRARVSDILRLEDPRLLVTRAMVSHPSLCEPTVGYQTVELSEGFAQLFPHIDGTTSVEHILQQLGQAGAPQLLLDGVKSGFLQLLEKGMLEAGEKD